MLYVAMRLYRRLISGTRGGQQSFASVTCVRAPAGLKCRVGILKSRCELKSSVCAGYSSSTYPLQVQGVVRAVKISGLNTHLSHHDGHLEPSVPDLQGVH